MYTLGQLRQLLEQYSDLPDQTVLCTTLDPFDDQVEEYAQLNNVHIYQIDSQALGIDLLSYTDWGQSEYKPDDDSSITG